MKPSEIYHVTKNGTSTEPNTVARESETVKRSLRLYLFVGLLLLCGTLATVAVATIPSLDVGGHGFDKWDALLGLMIASTKALLVAGVFMHLKHERRLIYGVFGLGVIHCVGLFIGTYMHFSDLTHDSYFYSGDKLPRIPLTIPIPW